MPKHWRSKTIRRSRFIGCFISHPSKSREQQKAAYYPTIYGSLTAVEPHEGSRIAAGNLNNPVRV